jgi:type IV secretory pathway VirB10-like protein
VQAEPTIEGLGGFPSSPSLLKRLNPYFAVEGRPSQLEQQAVDEGGAALAVPVADGSAWIVCTDPKTRHVYYYNQQTQVSSWTKPEELKVDFSRAPGPPSVAKTPAGRRPPPPPRRADVGAVASGWEEVRPEESMWSNPREVMTAATTMTLVEEQPEDQTEVDHMIEMKTLTMKKGDRMEEDYEHHEKDIFEKKSSQASISDLEAFTRKRSAGPGIRRKSGQEEDL